MRVADIPHARLAVMTRASLLDMLRGFPLRLALDAMNRDSNIAQSLGGAEVPHDEPRVNARNLEVPSGGAAHAWVL